MTLQTRLKNIFSRQNIFLIAVAIFGFAILPYIYKKSPVKIEVTQDKSLPHHIWITLPYLQKPYVEFPVYFDNPYFKKGKDYLVKILVCDEGHYLKVDENKNYYCDGEFLGKAVDTDSKGNSIENFKWDGPIPEGKAFVMGTHRKSYDSRYFGFIDKSKIIKYLYPLK
ncbi:S26 family signal peptidase [Persephonella sp.]